MKQGKDILLVIALPLLSISAHAAELDVTIIDSQDHADSYVYVVPGSSTATSSANVNCIAGFATANCDGSSRTTSFSSPGFVGEYTVQGATLSLQLPDGRVAVVNCDSKIYWKNPRVRRDCRVPLIRNIKAEFRGDNAKLKWPVSIDGRKMQSETYTILAVLDETTVLR